MYNGFVEQHPVPKNVLNVEFKLFGTLTVKQFLKVLAGCAIALVLFVIDINILIKLPLILASLGIGILSALMPGFETKFLALLRAVFVSPQYVWRKDTKVPEVLTENAKPQTSTAQKQETQISHPQSPEDLSIDQILATRAVMGMDQPESQSNTVAPAQSTPAPATPATPAPAVAAPAPAPVAPVQQSNQLENESTHFDKLYSDLYGVQSLNASIEARQNQHPGQSPVTAVNNLASATNSNGTKIPVGPNMQMNVQPLRNSAPRAMSKMPTPDQVDGKNLLAEYQQELGMLQQALRDLSKQGGDDAKKQQIMQRINEVYAAIKQAGALPSVAPTPMPAQPAAAQEPQTMRMLYGVVVDKKDMPISGVHISILNNESKPLLKDIITKEDGSFAIEATLPEGDYIVDLQSDSHKFYQFRIVISKDQLPAFKFRER